MKKLHLGLLDIIEANFEGVRQDQDSEFLHDYRVSVRRTRAALTQVKQVFPPRIAERFRRDFAWLGRVTGPSRDLDVHLIKMASHRRSLPESTSADLVPLVDFVRQQKSSAHRRLLEDLESRRYAALMSAWRRFLLKPVPASPTAALALQPIERVAKRRLVRAYRRVVKRGRRIDDASPAEDLHKLRLDCKKLRYLSEFFRSLFEPEGVGLLIRQLKRLQNNLGDFNDLQVQQAALKRWAEKCHGSGALPASTLLAMGRLLDLLERREVKKRSRFARAFDEFDRPANRRLFKRLVAGTA